MHFYIFSWSVGLEEKGFTYLFPTIYSVSFIINIFLETVQTELHYLQT